MTFGGLSSSYAGGYFSDKYEKRIPRIKGYISGFGALASTVFIVLTYSFKINFYFQMFTLLCAYLTAEMWYGPAHAAVNRLFPSEFQGIAIAIYTLTGALSGALATYLLGLTADRYDTANYPLRSGYCLTAFVLFSYCTCCPMFLLAAKEYEKFILGKQDKLNKSQLSFAKQQT